MSGRHRARLGSGWVHFTVDGGRITVQTTRRLLRQPRALITLLAGLDAAMVSTGRSHRGGSPVMVRPR